MALRKSAMQWAFLPALLLLLFHLQAVWRTNEPKALDPQLKVLAMGTFITALTFSLGLVLA
ncbi:MAG TPA: hypothetical protein PK760_16455 [Flavobacteriales bacterium]|nr:hypothetical protein [Flavobacteriales bacterium]